MLHILSCHLPVQVFVALLRISQPDGRRAVVRQALDVLTPALVKRLPQGENRYPIWIRSLHFQNLKASSYVLSMLACQRDPVRVVSTVLSAHCA